MKEYLLTIRIEPCLYGTELIYINVISEEQYNFLLKYINPIISLSFGEICGKHSEINYALELNELHFDESEIKINKFKELFPNGIMNFDIFELIESQLEQYEE